MEYRRKITIREVRTARLLVRQLHESGGAPAGGMLTEEMHNAVLALQERMANLDHQWQRAIILDLHGIFVYDEQGPNWWKWNVWLDSEAKTWNDGQVRNYAEERRRILEWCDLPPRLVTVPPPRAEAASATPSHSNYYRPPSADNRTPTPPRSRARPHPPEPEQEPPEQQAPGSRNGTSRERALTKARPPEEPRQHTPRDRRSLNNTHQPGQAGSAMLPPKPNRDPPFHPTICRDGGRVRSSRGRCC